MRIIFVLLGAFLVFFGAVDICGSGIFHGKKTKVREAEIIDEAEDEIYDNTGGVKTRIFKVYRYEENGEGVVVRSKRPMRRESGSVGKRCVVSVNEKNRTAVERADSIFYFLCGIILVLLGLFILLLSLEWGFML